MIETKTMLPHDIY